MCYNAVMKRSSAKRKGGAAKRSAKSSWITFAKSHKVLAGIVVYLVIGLVWSLVQLVGSKPPAYNCPDSARPGQAIMVDQPTASECTRPPEAGLAAKAASVGVSTVLWLPLIIVSGLTD